MRFFIPNFLTLSNLIIGFICIISIINQSNDFPILILFYACLFLDFLDGFLARKLKTTSEFGKQLDSLADLVSFALLPALILYYHLENISDNILLKYISIFIVVFSAIRLAKFNISKKGNAFFEGLPTPANALFFMSLLYYDGNLNKYLTSEKLKKEDKKNISFDLSQLLKDKKFKKVKYEIEILSIEEKVKFEVNNEYLNKNVFNIYY